MTCSVLIVGATRGLGASLTKLYAADPSITVYGTTRGSPPADFTGSVTWIPEIDVSEPDSAPRLAEALPSRSPIDLCIISAGYFGLESFEDADFEKELLMYKTSAIGPVFIIRALVRSGILVKGSKIILVSSESGSITLRHESEGGGNYGHHASKAALNMVGKLLSLDLKDKGVAVALVHPGFMRTEMTKGVGFDKYWDDGGAVTPDEAAKSLADWIETFDMSKTGQYWAPRGPGDIGTAEHTLGPKKDLSTPLQLPW